MNTDRSVINWDSDKTSPDLTVTRIHSVRQPRRGATRDLYRLPRELEVDIHGGRGRRRVFVRIWFRG